MYLEANSDVFDAFLASRQGKCIVGAASLIIGVVFLVIRLIVEYHDQTSLKNDSVVNKCEAVIRRDALLLFGSVALMLGAVYLVWSAFPVQ